MENAPREAGNERASYPRIRFPKVEWGKLWKTKAGEGNTRCPISFPPSPSFLSP